MLGSLIEGVNVAIFLKIHFTQMMGSLWHGVLFMVYMEHVQYTEQRCSIVFVEDRLDEIVMQTVIV